MCCTSLKYPWNPYKGSDLCPKELECGACKGKPEEQFRWLQAYYPLLLGELAYAKYNICSSPGCGSVEWDSADADVSLKHYPYILDDAWQYAWWRVHSPYPIAPSGKIHPCEFDKTPPDGCVATSAADALANMHDSYSNPSGTCF